jgi:hypothetical protein
LAKTLFKNIILKIKIKYAHPFARSPDVILFFYDMNFSLVAFYANVSI